MPGGHLFLGSPLASSLRRWKFAIVAAIGLAGLALIVFIATPTTGAPSATPSDPPPPREVLRRDPPAQPQSITLLQAWNIATQAARIWDAEAELTRLHAVDGPGDSTAGVTPGSDGKRGRWMARAVSPQQQGHQAFIDIVNGQAVSVVDQPQTTNDQPAPTTPAIDSPAALDAALAARPQLAPAGDKLHGYGFSAQTDVDGRLTVNVIGEYRKHPALVTLDAVSGQFVRAEAAAPSSHAYISGDAGVHWTSTNVVPGFVAGVVGDGTSGVGFAVTNTLDSLQLWKTTDGGKGWQQVGVLPRAGGTWAYGLALIPGNGLAVGTDAGLWVLSDNGATWERVATLPEGAPQWLAPMRAGDRWGLVVSVSSGPGIGLYASPDLLNWQHVAREVYRLSQGQDGTVTAVPDGPTGQARVISWPQVRGLDVPPGTLRAAGKFGSLGPVIAQGTGSVVVSRDGGATWTETLNETLTSLAVAPDFQQSGVVLVGTGTGEVLQSLNGGRTWGTPTPLGNGAQFVTILSFLSRTNVVAIAEGGITWQPF